MALAIKKTLAFLMITILFQVSSAIVYTVGDSAGWKVPSFGSVDYKKWASNKTFHVGDVVLFNYDKRFNNVEQVTLKNYQSCNDTSSIASYDTGNDTVTLITVGQKYYICGVPRHCDRGQKVHINVTVRSYGASPTTI